MTLVQIVGLVLLAFVLGFIVADWTRRKPRIWERGVLVRDITLATDKTFLEDLEADIKRAYKRHRA